jgi:hypothetical protein
MLCGDVKYLALIFANDQGKPPAEGGLAQRQEKVQHHASGSAIQK